MQKINKKIIVNIIYKYVWRYKINTVEIIKKKSLGYYYTNWDAICKKNNEKYSMLTPEQKKKIGKSIKSVGMKAYHLKENKR